MYLRTFDDLERKEDDNPTIGLLLCTETDLTIAKYSVLNENKQLFANKYLPYLQTEEELEVEIGFKVGGVNRQHNLDIID